MQLQSVEFFSTDFATKFEISQFLANSDGGEGKVKFWGAGAVQEIFFVKGLGLWPVLSNIPNFYNIHGLFLCLKKYTSKSFKMDDIIKWNMCAKRQKKSVLLVPFHVFLSVC